MSCCSASRTAVSPPAQLTDPAAPADPAERSEPPGHRRSEQPRSEHSHSPGSGAHAAAGAQHQQAAPRSDEAVVALPGGTFWMGSQDEDANPYDGEGPVRQVEVAPFSISRYAVTNQEFSRFVDQTDYTTEAQEFGWSFVFAAFLPGRLRAQSPRAHQTPWWCGVTGAYWAAPQGPGSSVEDIMDHPVVHVSWRDAEAFASWAGGRLPTETQWEYAARGGLDRARYPWGDELTPGGEHRCNIWQGVFPTKNTADDGHRGTAPVDAYLPNGYGLHNVAGNVWEMCGDRWRTDFAAAHQHAGGEERRVMRGGSYLCHHSYCNRYRVAARSSNGVDSSSGNQGFRLVFES